MRRFAITIILGASLAAVGLSTSVSAAPRPGGSAAPSAHCASPNHPGGEWPSYGQNLSNTRAQADEKTIGTSNVGSLQAAWSFSGADEGGTGPFQSTPIVAEGCVYITSASGYIYALNADTGKLVWKGRYSKTVDGVCCGGTLFAPTVEDGVLYQLVSRNTQTAGKKNGPFVLAIDAHSGHVIWNSGSVTVDPGAYTNASTVLYHGLIFFGISGAEGGSQNAAGYAILDAKTGKVLTRVHTVPDRYVKEGYGGGSIWSTGAVDTKTGYLFVGSGQPTNPNREYPLVNAILKIDLDRSRSTFGEIVDAVKGSVDSKLESSPTCQDGPDQTATLGCAYTDVDMAASPTLMKNSRDQDIVVDYQKSGVLHAAYRSNMEWIWDATLSPVGSPLGNYTSTATDGKQIFAVGTYPGQIFGIDPDFGSYNWVSPVVTTLGANPVAYANGVVYHADGKGFLDAYDAATGAPLLHRPMSFDVGNMCTNLGGGVAIARHTIYAVCGDGPGGSSTSNINDAPTGWVIAYRLPG